jgi:hypothetical protein
LEGVPGAIALRLAADEGIGVSFVLRILHEHSPYPYHIHRVKALTPFDHRANEVFSRRLLSKCAVNTQFVANIVLTDESGFTRGAIVNFHNSHV